MRTPISVVHAFLLLAVAACASRQLEAAPVVLRAEAFQHCVDAFNAADEELHRQHVPNAAAWDFLKQNIPLLDCPDRSLEEVYYFRWWTFRKHIRRTPDGFVITEFLPPVGWAGKHNSIDCAAGHHFYEGRWLRDPSVLDDYGLFWFRKGGDPRRYSFWAADALWARYLVGGDTAYVKGLLPDLIENFRSWEHLRLDPLPPYGLFWQCDGLDGMEMGIGGSGYRPTINSYMFGDALAISRIAGLAGEPAIAREFRETAEKIKEVTVGRPALAANDLPAHGGNARMGAIRFPAGRRGLRHGGLLVSRRLRLCVADIMAVALPQGTGMGPGRIARGLRLRGRSLQRGPFHARADRRPAAGRAPVRPA
jgi:hypothetical protein